MFSEHDLGALAGPSPRNLAADASGRLGGHLEASNNLLLGRVHNHHFSLYKIWFWEHEAVEALQDPLRRGRRGGNFASLIEQRSSRGSRGLTKSWAL